MGHQVIYLESELIFYFYDSRDRVYKPTSEEKLGNLLRAYLVRCAEELPGSVHKLSLFHEFRSDKNIKAIVHRAKSILAASPSFFAINSNNVRENGPELHERVARHFVQTILEAKPNEILTMHHCYRLFSDFLQKRELSPLNRHLFNGLIPPMIREQFNLGVRKDLVDQNQKYFSGWKGLQALDSTPAGTND